MNTFYYLRNNFTFNKILEFLKYLKTYLILINVCYQLHDQLSMLNVSVIKLPDSVSFVRFKGRNTRTCKLHKMLSHS